MEKYYIKFEITKFGNGHERRMVYIDKRVPTEEDITSGETSYKMWKQICTTDSNEVRSFLESISGQYNLFCDRVGEFSEYDI